MVESIEQFCKSRKKLKTPVMVVMEATGGYETILVRELAKHNICAAAVNPRQVRDFAKGIGTDAKADKIDAKVIARFTEVVKPACTVMLLTCNASAASDPAPTTPCPSTQAQRAILPQRPCVVGQQV